MTQPAKSQEPSMEEILASIRRIIADDDASKTAQRTAEAPRPAPKPVPPAPLPRPSPQAAQPEPPAPEPQAEESPFDEAGADAEVLEDQASDILDLTESMTRPAPSAPAPAPMASPAPAPAPQFRKIEAYSDVSFEEAEQSRPMPRAAERPAPHIAHEAIDQSELLSSAASAAVDSAFNALAQTVLVKNARTLEDLVREMLRPMLKTWLDDNLPSMVERLVRAEIERVARGR